MHRLSSPKQMYSNKSPCAKKSAAIWMKMEGVLESWPSLDKLQVAPSTQDMVDDDPFTFTNTRQGSPSPFVSNVWNIFTKSSNDSVNEHIYLKTCSSSFNYERP